jgi:transposase
MVQRARRERGFALLQTIPGVGPVIASGYLALIETPHRFSHKNKLWKYAGYGNQRQESSDKVYVDKPSKTGNRPLKWLVGEHFMAAVKRKEPDNRFHRQYTALVARGLSEACAERHVRRTLLSVVRAVWRKGEEYRDDLVK